MDFNLTKSMNIVKAARKFAQGEFPDRAVAFDRQETFDLKIWKKACELGFVGVFIDEKYGGAGYGFFEHCLINEEFWAVEPGMAMRFWPRPSVPNCCRWSAETQKQLLLPRLVAGAAIMGTAITEPDAGCDVTGAVTTAVNTGDAWVINGSKMFATNGTVANFMLIFCRTEPENESPHRRHSFILVPTDTPGFKAAKIRGKLGIRASDTAELVLKDVRVPPESLVGEQGQGFYDLMEFFNRTRLHVCAQAVGLARGALEEAVRHAKGRCQFGQPLAAFQVTQFKLAEMATRIRAARNLYYEAAWFADRESRITPWSRWPVVFGQGGRRLRGRGGAAAWRIWVYRRIQGAAVVPGRQDPEIYEGTKEIEKTIVARSILK